MDIKVAFIDLQVILYCMTFTIYKKVRILFLKHNPGDSPKKKEKKRKKGFGHLNWAYVLEWIVMFVTKFLHMNGTSF